MVARPVHRNCFNTWKGHHCSQGASSVNLAASAAIDHMRDWWQGTNGRIVSMAIPSEGWYGVPEGLVFSFPCRCENGDIMVVEDLTIDAFTQSKSMRILQSFWKKETRSANY